MDPGEAEERAKEGGLVGTGCEDHEEKVRARGERLERKRKNGREGRREAKAAKKEGKNRAPAIDQDEGMEVEENEEEKFVAGLTA